MKRALLIIFALFSTFHLRAQNFQTVEEVNNACAQIDSDSAGEAQQENSSTNEAGVIVDRILNEVGLFRNFTIQECPDINNAIAKNIDTDAGIKERYIFYDASFFDRISNQASTDWAATSILAHEIGHHLNGHALNNQGSTHKFELEADEFSGFVLGKMNAGLEEAQSAIQTLQYEEATATHPAKEDRLTAIAKGWTRATGRYEQTNEEIVTNEQAERIYREGEKEFTKQNYSQSLSLFHKATELGSVDSYFYLSEIYYSGLGVKIDYNQAYEYAKKGYEQGSVPATYQLGKYLSEHSGPIMNKKESERLFQKDFQLQWFTSQYEKYNIPYLAYIVGDMYFLGYGGATSNTQKAVEWYQKAADENVSGAKNQLAMFYKFGMEVNEDDQKALSFYQQSAQSGNAEAMYELGLLYLNSSVVEQDYDKAMEWYQKAAALGHTVSMCQIGDMYKLGKGVKRNNKKAMSWYEKAVKKNDILAMYLLGQFYDTSVSIKDAPEQAIYWYERAAERGSFPAYKKLANAYLVTKNVDKAIYWFEKAAAHGDIMAKAHLERLKDPDYRKIFEKK